MHIDHIRLLVVNFAECFHFYRDVIGLKVLWGNEADSYASFAEKDARLPNIALFRRQLMAEVLGTSQRPMDANHQDREMLIIGVANVDAEVTRMQASGITIILGPQDLPAWGMRSAYLRDPDGNLIELTGALPPDQWTPELRKASEQYRNE